MARRSSKPNHHAGETDTPRVGSGMGARLYQWRTEREVPLYQVARGAKFAYSKLWAMETEQGNRLTKLDAVERLAAYMGVSPAWLAWGDGDE